MAKTFEQVKQSAIVIKEESRQGRNTAPRVGQTIEDAIDTTEEAISAEATARQSAINLEVTAREGAVNGVKSEIEVERNRITVIANRQTATDNALIATNQSISSEAERRANADADITRLVQNNVQSIQSQNTRIDKLNTRIDLIEGDGSGGIGEELAERLDALESGKVDSEDGKGLSSNDFSSSYKDYLDGLMYQKPTVSFAIAGFPTATQEVGYAFVGSKSVTNTTTNAGNIPNGYTLSGTGSANVAISPNVAKDVVFAITTTATGSKTVTLSGTDIKGNTISATKSFSALLAVYHGQADNNASATVLAGLTKQLNTSAINTTITGNGKYFYLCVPSGRNLSSFMCNGFPASFMAVKTMTLTNVHGHSAEYKVYQSAVTLDSGASYNYIIS